MRAVRGERAEHHGGFRTLDRMTAVNVGGVVAAIRAAAPVIADGGRIITMSSGIAARVGAAGVADYAASKAAIEGYTKGAARDLAGRNITVTRWAWAPVTTDMNPGVGEFADWLRSLTALGRYGTPEEIANVAVFCGAGGQLHHRRGHCGGWRPGGLSDCGRAGVERPRPGLMRPRASQMA